MLDAIADIGKMQFNKIKEKGGDILDILVQDPSDGGRYNNIIIIVIKKTEEQQYLYDGLQLREYDEDDRKKYLYRAGASRGADFTPTAKITEGSKTFSNKIVKALEDTILIKEERFQEEVKELKEVKKVLTEKETLIKKELEAQSKALGKDQLSFLTIMIQEQYKERFVGDYEVFKYKIIEEATKKYHYSTTYKVSSRAEDKVCSVCLNKTDVNGLGCPFPFTTFDKIGYLSGGFSREKAWRNVPICRQCSLELELGKDYLDKNLRFYFFGMNYYIIPKPLDIDDLPKVLNNYKRLKQDDGFKEHQHLYITTEEKIIKKLGEDVNKLGINLMFFKEKNSAFNILTNIEDVFPSRLKDVFDQIAEVNDLPLFKNYRISSVKEMSIFINFKTLYEVLREKANQKYFLECIYKIFKGDKIDYNFLLRFIVEDILQSFDREELDKKEKSFPLTVMAGYGLLYLLKKIDALNYLRREELILNQTSKNNYDLKNYKNKKEMFESFLKIKWIFLICQ